MLLIARERESMQASGEGGGGRRSGGMGDGRGSVRRRRNTCRMNAAGRRGGTRVHLTIYTVDFIVFTVAVIVFFTFVFLNFESENTGYRYR